MCGICGIINTDKGKHVSAAAVEKMREALVHRGPDDYGQFVENNVGLAMRRLNVIDLDTGHQPIFNEDRTVCVVFNGEIYNFRELRFELIKKGHRFCTKSDTEVIAHLYEEEGIGCVRRLNGMFAVVIWDKKEEVLSVARDRMGQKPFYYYFKGDRFIFSSEIKSLLNNPDISAELDIDSLNEYMTFEYVPAPRSIFRDIKKLPASHTLVLKDGRLRLERYWSPEFCGSGIKICGEKAVEERLFELMTNAVERHLVSDVPIGIFLSGGIDSSAVSAIASRILNRKLKTFSVNFKEKSFDESRYSRIVARHIGSEHHEMDFGSKECLDVMPEICTVLDEPLADASIFPTYILSRYTKRYVTVALGGDGGDEIFAGYPTHIAHRFAEQYYLKLPAMLRKNVIENIAGKLPVSFDNFSLDFKAKKFISGVDSDPCLRHQTWVGAFSPSDKTNLFSKRVKERLGGKSGMEPLSEKLEEMSRQALSMHEKILFLDMRLYLQDDILTKTDRASMANSLEVRAPFLDNELIDYVNMLGTDCKVRNFRTKLLLKKILLSKDIIPAVIINRSKKGFSVPVAEWINGPLNGMIRDVLSEESIRKADLFEPSYIRKLLKEHFERRKNHRKLIWTLLMFELWRKGYGKGS